MNNSDKIRLRTDTRRVHVRKNWHSEKKVPADARNAVGQPRTQAGTDNDVGRRMCTTIPTLDLSSLLNLGNKQLHTDGVPPSCVSGPGCNKALPSTSFQSESHPVPLGQLDPLGQFLNDTEGKKKTLLDKGTD